jgi:hypothetical protein
MTGGVNFQGEMDIAAEGIGMSQEDLPEAPLEASGSPLFFHFLNIN